MTGASAWMPLYIGDYLGDTQRLTAEQHGIYLLLLMDYWRNGPPPVDDVVLAQIGRVSLPGWRKSKATILRFFTESEGQLHHTRVDKELAKAGENHDRRSAKAKKAADARWHGSDDATSNAPSIPQALPGECPLPPPKKGSDTDVSAAKPPGDPVKALFDLGVSLMVSAGKTEERARSMVGKWRASIGDDKLRPLLMAAFDKTEPIEWIEAAVRNDGAATDEHYAAIERKYAVNSAT